MRHSLSLGFAAIAVISVIPCLQFDNVIADDTTARTVPITQTLVGPRTMSRSGIADAYPGTTIHSPKRVRLDHMWDPV